MDLSRFTVYWFNPRSIFWSWSIPTTFHHVITIYHQCYLIVWRLPKMGDLQTYGFHGLMTLMTWQQPPMTKETSIWFPIFHGFSLFIGLIPMVSACLFICSSWILLNSSWNHHFHWSNHAKSIIHLGGQTFFRSTPMKSSFFMVKLC